MEISRSDCVSTGNRPLGLLSEVLPVWAGPGLELIQSIRLNITSQVTRLSESYHLSDRTLVGNSGKVPVIELQVEI